MNRFLSALCLFSVAAVSFAGIAAAENTFTTKHDRRPVVIAPPQQDVPAGEHLKYEVRWLGIPIGIGEIRVEPGRLPDGTATVQITAQAKATPFLASFYPVTDTLTSIAMPRTYYVLRSGKDLREGKYRAHEEIEFDYPAKVARFVSLHNGSKKDIPLDGFCHDVLSAFYWFRTQPVKVGGSVRTTVNADEKNWDFAVNITRTERLELRGLGTFETFVAEPKAKFKGILVDRGRAWVNFTADERRIPLKIKLETPYGPVLGIIESLPEKV